MNWINNVVRPKIRSLLPSGKREVPENMWVKCPDSGQMVYYKDLEANQFVIPGSNYHMRMTAQQRLQSLFDNGEYVKVPVQEVAQDPLKFRDGRKYAERLKTAKAETDLDDAVLVGRRPARRPGSRRRRAGLPLHGRLARHGGRRGRRHRHAARGR